MCLTLDRMLASKPWLQTLPSISWVAPPTDSHHRVIPYRDAQDPYLRVSEDRNRTTCPSNYLASDTNVLGLGTADFRVWRIPVSAGWRGAMWGWLTRWWATLCARHRPAQWPRHQPPLLSKKHPKWRWLPSLTASGLQCRRALQGTRRAQGIGSAVASRISCLHWDTSIHCDYCNNTLCMRSMEVILGWFAANVTDIDVPHIIAKIGWYWGPCISVSQILSERCPNSWWELLINRQFPLILLFLIRDAKCNMFHFIPYR